MNHSEIEALLREDLPYFDLTSSLLDPSAVSTEILFSPKEPVTVCGSEEAEQIFTLLGTTADLIQTPINKNRVPGKKGRCGG
ncbi:MAG: hypothetical protein MI684_00145 [Chlorobiales bacterium]|nr:hypothetical protein [Chlorobiales bacterium]